MTPHRPQMFASRKKGITFDDYRNLLQHCTPAGPPSFCTPPDDWF
jgi:hypothetical protein